MYEKECCFSFRKLLFTGETRMKCARLFTAAVLGGVLVVFLSSPAQSDTIVDVSEDGYAAMGGGMWIMGATYCKAFASDPGYDAWGYIKFDMDAIEGMTGDDVASATLNLYITGQQGAGLTPYPEGETGSLEISAYADAYTADLIVSGTTVAADIPGGDIYPYSVSVEITDIVKKWLDGDYVNHGLKIENPPPADGYGFYWNASRAASNCPYLEVNAVPEPGTLALLASGLALIGLITLRRRRSAG